MASRSRSNAQGGNKRGRSASRQRAPQHAPEQAFPSIRGSAGGDIVGLFLAVVAIAMIISLAAPSSAPVTQATGNFLTLCFGAGAFLFPVALFVFAMTFFLDDEESISGRVALGLTLIIVSVLSLISLNAPGAESTPDLVISPASVGRLGGYVGGGVAWTLLMSVGRWVGVAILVGTIIAGIVVCGFSISGAVSKMRGRASIAAENYREVREERREIRAQRASERKAQRRAEREAAIQAMQARPAPAAAPTTSTRRAEPKTTFLGARKTSVLTRSHADDLVTEVDAASQRLIQRRHPALDVEKALPAADVMERQDALFGAYEQEDLPWAPPSFASLEEELVVPDFLKNGKRSRAEGRSDDDAPQQEAVPDKKPASTQKKTQRRKKAQPAPKASVRPGEKEQDGTYELPAFSMLSSNPNSASSASSQEELDETMARLQSTLAEFGLTSRVVDYTSGPLVTTFQVEMGEGERVNKITNLQDDIALSLAAKSVRIFAPIPGTSRVGIEIPNKSRQNVHLGDVLPYASGGPLEFAIGRDAEGRAVTADLAAMPHLLVAGATGSGKSVMINSLIMSLLMRDTPKQVRLILVDPKRVEFSGYNGLPHLYVPVVTEPRQAASALQWAVSEMERRLKVFERAGARNINVYNEMCTKGKLSEMDNPPEPMPFMVIIIDELADLMMVAGKDVEASIVRIAQLARAAGIHLVLATQRPSANVVTGLIKSNIETRIALSVASGTDSRVILDQVGAQRLLGNGDMLFKERGGLPRRVLGCYVSDPEIEAVVDFIREQAEPDYHEEILSAVVPGTPGGGSSGDAADEDDPLVWEAAQIVVESQLGSTSGLQRRLKVGYARAGRIMDMLESKGVVGPPDGSKPREVLLDMEGLEELRLLDEQYREV